MNDYDILTNSLTFRCPQCRTATTLEFSEDFAPNEQPNFTFGCVACSTRLRVTNWTPLYIIRDLPHKTLAKNVSLSEIVNVL